MQILALKTPLVKENDDLFQIIKNALDAYLADTHQSLENSVLAVTSKIISYAQNRLVEKTPQAQTDEEAERAQKHQLVKQEADAYLPASYSKYNLMLAIKHNILTVNAGIDESNANGKFVLWPTNLQATTNQIWQFIRQTYQVQNFGVIVTDSRTQPLRWGVVGNCLTHCGFLQLRDYRGVKDLHQREITMVQVNVAEALGVAMALEMGEVAEQTPLAVATGIKHIQFQDHVPTAQELADLVITRQDDVYGPFLNSVEWVENKKA